MPILNNLLIGAGLRNGGSCWEVMNGFSLNVASWSSWIATADGDGDWCHWPARTVDMAVAPMILRRRVSRLGQQALRLAWNTPLAAQARLVFSSRHGEFTRTLSIMDALVHEQEVSPADFTLSVHHALAGLLSIASVNRQGHVAVSAGRDSFFAALIEAAGCLQADPSVPVLLVHYDEPLPPPFRDFAVRDGESVALVLLLTSDASDLSLTVAALPQEGDSAPAPGRMILDLLHGNASHVRVGGDRHVWSMEVSHASA